MVCLGILRVSAELKSDAKVLMVKGIFLNPASSPEDIDLEGKIAHNANTVR